VAVPTAAEVVPSVFDSRVVEAVAEAVAQQARAEGNARD
jgi:malic enzyme